MGKITSIRLSEDLLLQITELSEMLNEPKSVIVRALCLRSINELQDDRGNWKIQKAENKGEDIKKTGIEPDNADTGEPLLDPSG